MPNIRLVTCYYCNNNFKVQLKRFNESLKHGWKFYCSAECHGLSKKKRLIIKCANPNCSNTFDRKVSEIKSASQFCSQSCAAKINNTKRKRFKKCAYTLCSKPINYGNKYCSNQCQRKHQDPTKSDHMYRAIKGISEFVLKNNRLPVKREVSILYKYAVKGYGSWNNAVKAAGLEPNPVLFAKKHIAKDGHKCGSLAEMIIDNWLYDNAIPHQIHIPYPINNKFTVDFVVGDIWIEFFGLYGDVRKYDESVKRKLKIAEEKGIFLIKLYPNHLFPKNQLDEVFKPVKEYAHSYAFALTN